jgi:hypothetical protein
MKITPPPGQRSRTADSVAASGVTVEDSGGYFPAGLTLEEILASIGAGTAPDSFLLKWGGGEGNVQALGTLGATETIDLANANYFWGTLDQACTISTTGWTSGKDCQITIELAQDGTGGWTPTFSGVTWIGAAPTSEPASTVTHAVLLSRDGGTTIYGAVVGGGGGATSDGMVPYYIASGDVFTVPLYKQALKAMAITVDGTLVVDGYLIEVT